jgi:regulator of replication initiation timing
MRGTFAVQDADGAPETLDFIMTRTQLKNHQDEIASAVLEQIPREIRAKARPAVDQAVIRAFELCITYFGERRDQTACISCKDFLDGVIKPFQIHND